MGYLVNILIFRWYAIAAKKVYRNHEEGTKKENYRCVSSG